MKNSCGILLPRLYKIHIFYKLLDEYHIYGHQYNIALTYGVITDFLNLQ